MKRTIYYSGMLMLLCCSASNHVFGSSLMPEEPKKMKRFFVKTKHAEDQESTIYYQFRDQCSPLVSSKSLCFYEKKKRQGVQYTPPANYEPMDDSDWDNFGTFLASVSEADLDWCSRRLETMDLDEDSPFDRID